MTNVQFLIPVGPGYDLGWLIDAVESCVQGPDLRILLINDGNKDRVPLDELAGPFVDVLHRKKNGGVAVALNDGFEACGDVQYVARMDADDMSMPGRVMNQTSWMSGRPEVIISGGRIVRMDVIEWHKQKSCFAVPAGSPSSILRSGRTPLPHPTWMIRKAALVDVLGKRPYPEDYPWAEDFALLCKLVKLKGDGCLLDTSLPLAGHRMHDKRSSNLHAKEQVKSREKALRWLNVEDEKNELAGDDGVGTGDGGVTGDDIQGASRPVKVKRGEA